MFAKEIAQANANHDVLFNSGRPVYARDYVAAAVTAIKAILKAEKFPNKEIYVRVHGAPMGAVAAVDWDVYRGHVSVNLYLPSFDPMTLIPRYIADLLTALWLHELGHVMFTDMPIYEQASRDKGHAFAHVMNGLEDVRIERAMINRNSAARRVFTELVQYMGEHTPRGHENDFRQLPWTLAYLGRHRVSGYDLAPRAADYWDALTDRNQWIADTAFRMLDTAQDTQRVFEITEWIFEQLKKQKEQPPDDTITGGEGNDTITGPVGEDTIIGDGPVGDDTIIGDGPGGDEYKFDDDSDDDGDDDQDSDDDGGNDAGTGDDWTGEPNDWDVETAEPDLDKETIEQTRGDKQPGRWADEINISEHDVIKAQPMFAASAAAVDHIKQLTDSVNGTARLRDQVRRMLKHPEQGGYSRFETSGRLDMRRMTAFGRDDTVFKKRFEVEAETAASYLLIDFSSSMHGSRIWSAMALAVQFIQAADMASAPMTVAGFRSHGGVMDCKLIELKSSRERWAAAMGRVANYGAYVGGGTHLAGGMLAAGEHLSREKNVSRRLLFTLADGDCSSGWDGVQSVTEYLQQRHGIEVIGIGIEQDCKHSFAKADAYQHVRSVKHLAKAGLKELADQLRRGKR